MPTYEYICLACEERFDERRPMTAAVTTAVSCPACGSGRVRRRFSVFSTGASGAGEPEARSGGCACGGACACGGR